MSINYDSTERTYHGGNDSKGKGKSGGGKKKC